MLVLTQPYIVLSVLRSDSSLLHEKGPSLAEQSLLANPLPILIVTPPYTSCDLKIVESLQETVEPYYG